MLTSLVGYFEQSGYCALAMFYLQCIILYLEEWHCYMGNASPQQKNMLAASMGRHTAALITFTAGVFLLFCAGMIQVIVELMD